VVGRADLAERLKVAYLVGRRRADVVKMKQARAS
jgi:hypothetical protein